MLVFIYRTNRYCKDNVFKYLDGFFPFYVRIIVFDLPSYFCPTVFYNYVQNSSLNFLSCFITFTDAHKNVLCVLLKKEMRVHFKISSTTLMFESSFFFSLFFKFVVFAVLNFLRLKTGRRFADTVWKGWTQLKVRLTTQRTISLICSPVSSVRTCFISTFQQFYIFRILTINL